MKDNQLLAILRLQSTTAVGSILAKKLIANVGSAAQVFKESAAALTKINGVGNHILKHLKDIKHLKLAEKELKYIKDNNIGYSYFLDANFPEHLKHCIDSPILLFKDGTIDLQDKKIISIVGTRNMTSYGRAFIQQFIEDIKAYNPIIVSGFAYGVDICAHNAAVSNNLQTIGVLAHGLDSIYPKIHKKYMAPILVNGGFLTEFWHKEQPLRENFLKRNRIVAGISKATVIVESASKGGSLVTADIANSYNRDVFAVPGRVTDVYSKGCNSLIKNNSAFLINSAQDLVKMLNWDVAKTPKQIQRQLFIELTETEQAVYDVLHNNGAQNLDRIALDTQIPVFRLSSLLLQLELKGVLKPLPGKLFELI